MLLLSGFVQQIQNVLNDFKQSMALTWAMYWRFSRKLLLKYVFFLYKLLYNTYPGSVSEERGWNGFPFTFQMRLGRGMPRVSHSSSRESPDPT